MIPTAHTLLQLMNMACQADLHRARCLTRRRDRGFRLNWQSRWRENGHCKKYAGEWRLGIWIWRPLRHVDRWRGTCRLVYMKLGPTGNASLTNEYEISQIRRCWWLIPLMKWSSIVQGPLTLPRANLNHACYWDNQRNLLFHLPVYNRSVLHEFASNVRELSLLQFRLPEYWVCITEPMLNPSVLLYVIQVNETTWIGISVSGGQNAPPSQLQRFFVTQIISIFRIQHTVCKCLSGTDTEEISGQTCAVGINVIESRAFGGSHASAHRPHRQPHAFVGVDKIGEDFRGRSDRDTALMAEFVEAALHT